MGYNCPLFLTSFHTLLWSLNFLLKRGFYVLWPILGYFKESFISRNLLEIKLNEVHFWKLYYFQLFKGLSLNWTGTRHPLPCNWLFCGFLVDLPSIIWTSFALFMSIYLSVFGQEICFCGDILVHIPSSIWTSFAHFTSIYLSVFGHVLDFLHLSKILILVFCYISVPTPPSHPKSGFFDKL